MACTVSRLVIVAGVGGLERTCVSGSRAGDGGGGLYDFEGRAGDERGIDEVGRGEGAVQEVEGGAVGGQVDDDGAAGLDDGEAFVEISDAALEDAGGAVDRGDEI